MVVIVLLLIGTQYHTTCLHSRMKCREDHYLGLVAKKFVLFQLVVVILYSYYSELTPYLIMRELFLSIAFVSQGFAAIFQSVGP
jgi:hypothetical protein